MRIRIEQNGDVFVNDADHGRSGWYLFGRTNDPATVRKLRTALLPETESADDIALINRMEDGSIRALRACIRWYSEIRSAAQ